MGRIDFGPAWQQAVATGDYAWNALIPDGFHPGEQGETEELLPVLCR